MIYIDTYDKEDRHIAKETSIQLIKKGESLLIYPEGAWNLTEALPVMKLYAGAVSMALETGVDIVPIAIEQYGKDFRENFAKDILSESGGAYTMKLVEDERYHDKDNLDYQTVFAFMKTLSWKKEQNFCLEEHMKNIKKNER